MSSTYFTDRDLGRAFPKALRAAGLSVESHDAHFGSATTDVEWLRTAGERDWYVITHDKRIRYRPNEKRTVMTAGVGMLVLVGSAPHAALARNFIATLPAIERFLRRHERPFIAKVFRPAHVPEVELGSKSGRIEMWLSRNDWERSR